MSQYLRGFPGVKSVLSVLLKMCQSKLICTRVQFRARGPPKKKKKKKKRQVEQHYKHQGNQTILQPGAIRRGTAPLTSDTECEPYSEVNHAEITIKFRRVITV
jgi:hypothetical protein